MNRTYWRCLTQLVVFGAISFHLGIAQADETENARSMASSTKRGLHPLVGPVDNDVVLSTFLELGLAFMEEGDEAACERVTTMARSAPRTANVSQPIHGKSELSNFSRMVMSSVMIGTIYDCGRCKVMHSDIAGGVIVSPDGLILTNYHVVDRSESKGTKAIFVMSYDGKAFPIAEILAASESADVALIKIESDSPLTASPIAEESPRPLSELFILSHPRNQFYVLTQGIVSRYATLGMGSQRTDWMEVTADFGGGSSGCGVFNANSELIGLVSRVYPLDRPGKLKSDSDDSNHASRGFTEMVIKRTVPHSQLLKCFHNDKAESLRNGTNMPQKNLAFPAHES